jgi:hypothetical protein
MTRTPFTRSTALDLTIEGYLGSLPIVPEDWVLADFVARARMSVACCRGQAVPRNPVAQYLAA